MIKNVELLKTGKKPAPGELILLQGLINTADLEDGTDVLADPAELKAWLVRHGLIAQSAAVTAQDYDTVISFRELMRQLLVAHHSEPIPAQSIQLLNRLVDSYYLVISFDPDGQPMLQPGGKGIAAVIGRFLAIIANASQNGTWLRLKICEASTCQWAFYDASKNHSGRWCSMSVCGGRTKARHYRKRHPRTP